MVCTNYMNEESICMLDIPVTPQFGNFFCKTNPEKCLFVKEIGTEVLKDRQMRETKPLSRIWRKP